MEEDLPVAEPIVVTRTIAGRMQAIELVRTKRDQRKQEIAYNSRPFVLCGLPLRRPPKGTYKHTRQNGKFFLQVHAHLDFGLPFGQDRLIPIWIATLAIRQKSRTVRFAAAADILREFGLPNNGKTYRRLIEGFQRVFTSTIFFGTEDQLEKAAVWNWSRFHFFDNMEVWFSKQTDQPTFPGEPFENVIVLSEQFWNEINSHPIPVDLDVVKALSHAPGALDFYMWLTWRCWTAKGQARIPLFGKEGLGNQLGVQEYTSERAFRSVLKRWLNIVHQFWPECPAEISEDGSCLVLNKGLAITTTAEQRER
jgi:Plasmid encoded RepA protein